MALTLTIPKRWLGRAMRRCSGKISATAPKKNMPGEMEEALRGFEAIFANGSFFFLCFDCLDSLPRFEDFFGVCSDDEREEEKRLESSGAECDCEVLTPP